MPRLTYSQLYNPDIYRHAPARPPFFRLTKKRWFGEWVALSATERNIMVSLWLYSNRQGQCYPSLRTLARQIGVDYTTTQRNMKNLEKEGFIQISRKIGGHNEYHLLK
jgi:DNA-binding MarR family transcriptional regulator